MEIDKNHDGVTVAQDESAPLLFNKKIPCDVNGQGKQENQTQAIVGPVVRSQRDDMSRRKFLRGIWLCLSQFCAGMVLASMGPAMLDLSLITHSNLQQASTFFVATSAGNVAGSLISGVLYDLVSKDLLFIFGMINMAVMASVLPFCSPYWLMIIVCFTLNFSVESVVTVCNADVMRLWGSDGDTIMQAVHFTYAVGGVISPLIVEPFLAPTCHPLDLNQSVAYLNHSSVFLKQSSGNGSSLDVTSCASSKSRIHFAFGIFALIVLLCAIPTVVEFVLEKRGRLVQLKPASGEDREVDTDEGKKQKGGHAMSRLNLPRVPYIGVSLWMCVFYVVFGAVEITLPLYLTTFVVVQMQWTKSRGAVLTSVFWISFAFSRLVCVFLVRVVTCLQLLFTCFSLLIPCYVCFLLSSMWVVDWGVWMSTLMAGVALSSVVASTLSWMNAELLPVNGRVTSAIFLSFNTGPMINPTILGYLLETGNAIGVMYVFLGEAIACVAIFVLLVCFSRVYLRRRYGDQCQGFSESIVRPESIVTFNYVTESYDAVSESKTMC